MEVLFDPSPYEVPMEMLGERPPMSAEEWLVIADQMHDERNYDAMEEACRKAERAKKHGQSIGHIALF